MHRITRFAARLLLSGAVTVTVAGPASRTIAQDAFPKQVRIVVPFSAGASNDAIARTIAGPLGKRLETTIIVENRPGAAGTIGADAVARSARDGSVLLLTSSTFLTAAATQARLPYDPITAFAPVATVGQNPSILAVPASSAFRSPAELFAAARAKPGDLTYGSAGVGSIGHLLTELISAGAGIQMRHVPYKGAANAAIDLGGGQIQVMISSYSTLSPYLKADKVRILAVTSRQPHPAFPDIPPLNATLAGFASETWAGVFAPAGTASRVLDRRNREINEVAALPETRAILEPDGMLPHAMTPASFAARMKQELAQWKQIATERRITAE